MSEVSTEYDIRDDELREQRTRDCESLLVASGYFRARIQGLDSFDKIVGGMVWCLSSCSKYVDVNLLYTENPTIKQKISLTEKIVKVLIENECPFTLEPHQLQGLDTIHIYPVIQWLVQEALKSRKVTTNFLHSLSLRAAETITNDFKGHGTVLEVEPVERIHKRTSKTCPKNLVEDALCTLAEYGLASNSSQETEEISEFLEEASVHRKVAAKKLDSLKEDLKEGGLTLEEKREQRLAQMRAKIEETKRTVEKNRQEKMNRKVENEELNNKMEKFKKAALIREIESFKMHLEKEDSLIKEISSMRSRHELDLQDLMLKTEKACQHREIIKDEDSAKKKLENYEETTFTLKKILAEKLQKTANLQCLIDSCLTTSILQEYEKRELERWNDVALLSRETRRTYLLYNMAVGIQEYHDKAIQLASRIEDVLPQACKPEYQDSFHQSIQDIFNSMNMYHKKIKMSVDVLEGQKIGLCEELGKFADSARIFHRNTDALKRVFETNKKLHEKAEEIISRPQ